MKHVATGQKKQKYKFISNSKNIPEWLHVISVVIQTLQIPAFRIYTGQTQESST